MSEKTKSKLRALLESFSYISATLGCVGIGLIFAKQAKNAVAWLRSIEEFYDSDPFDAVEGDAE